MILSICGAAILIGVAALVIFGRIRFRATYDKDAFAASLLCLSCGLEYTHDKKRLALRCGRYRHVFGGGTPKPEKKKKETAPRKKKEKKIRPKLPWRVRVRIGKAIVLCTARFLVSVHYDLGRVRVRPVFANPALAGMVYGFGQAFSGAFGRIGEAISMVPDFAAEKTTWSGEIAISIGIRQIIVITCRFIMDLPIKNILKYRYFTRGE